MPSCKCEGKRWIHVKWNSGVKAAQAHTNCTLTSFTKQNHRARKAKSNSHLNSLFFWKQGTKAIYYTVPREVPKHRTELNPVVPKGSADMHWYTSYKKHCIRCESPNRSVWIPNTVHVQSALPKVADEGTVHLLMHGSHLSLSSLCPESYETGKYEKEREPKGKTMAAHWHSLWFCFALCCVVIVYTVMRLQRSLSCRLYLLMVPHSSQ